MGFTFYFPQAGIEINPIFPPLVAFIVSFFTSMGGISGAFLLLPYQISILGFTGTGVTGTNHLFNVFATPGGVYRFFREGRMFYPLLIVVVLGTLPGVLAGYYLRVLYLPDASLFRFFAGIVLLGTGVNLAVDMIRKRKKIDSKQNSVKGAAEAEDYSITNQSYRKGVISFTFNKKEHSFRIYALFIVSMLVGIVGGAYGIGGGSIISPFLISVLEVPVYVIAGSVLFSTFLTSLVAVIFFTFLPELSQTASSPDFSLGLLLGIGGFAGMYFGAKMQKKVSQNIIKSILVFVLLFVSLKYIYSYIF